MPIYEYDCGKCGKRTEVIQRVGEAPLKVCPHCGGRLKKAISAPAIQFKGSGWYVTDYARAKRESGSSAKAGSDSGDKGEKSAEKSEKAEKHGDADKASKSEKSASKTDKKKS